MQILTGGLEGTRNEVIRERSNIILIVLPIVGPLQGLVVLLPGTLNN